MPNIFQAFDSEKILSNLHYLKKKCMSYLPICILNNEFFSYVISGMHTQLSAWYTWK